MIRVDFLRHGETDAAGLLLGRTDPPLSPAGRAAVARQTDGRTWGAIVTSPLARARESAAIAARDRPARIDLDWREIDFGDWDGEHHEALLHDAQFAAFHQDPDANSPPNGEQTARVRARVTAALQRLAAYRDGPVLVVAHGGTIRMALAILIGLPLERMWAIRIGHATRVSVEMGIHAPSGLWGEIVEIAQPVHPQGESP